RRAHARIHVVRTTTTGHRRPTSVVGPVVPGSARVVPEVRSRSDGIMPTRRIGATWPRVLRPHQRVRSLRSRVRRLCSRVRRLRLCRNGHTVRKPTVRPRSRPPARPPTKDSRGRRFRTGTVVALDVLAAVPASRTSPAERTHQENSVATAHLAHLVHTIGE